MAHNSTATTVGGRRIETRLVPVEAVRDFISMFHKELGRCCSARLVARRRLQPRCRRTWRTPGSPRGWCCCCWARACVVCDRLWVQIDAPHFICRTNLNLSKATEQQQKLLREEEIKWYQPEIVQWMVDRKFAKDKHWKPCIFRLERDDSSVVSGEDWKITSLTLTDVYSNNQNTSILWSYHYIYAAKMNQALPPLQQCYFLVGT